MKHIDLGQFFSFPWNQHTFLGWLGEFIICVMGSVTYNLISALMLMFFITNCLFHLAIYETYSGIIDQTNEIQSFNHLSKKLKLKQCLSDAVRIHSEAKR